MRLLPGLIAPLAGAGTVCFQPPYRAHPHSQPVVLAITVGLCGYASLARISVQVDGGGIRRPGQTATGRLPGGASWSIGATGPAPDCR